MTVQELIILLSKEDLDKQVVFNTCKGWDYSLVSIYEHEGVIQLDLVNDDD